MVTYKVTVIGAGRAGNIHLQSLLQLSSMFEVVNVVDDNPSQAIQLLLSSLKGIRLRPVKETDAAIDEADVVCICVPTPLHEQVILRALKRDKHVFCEKPLVHTLEAVATVYDTAEQRGLNLLCAMLRRFDTPAAKVKQQIEAGELGTLLNINQVNRDCPYPPMSFLQRSPNIYYDCGTHDVDLALWLMGEKPHTVFCMGHAFDPSLKGLDDHDNGTVVMQFPSGAVSCIELSRFSNCGFDQRFMVHGDKKSAGSISQPVDVYVEMSHSGGLRGSVLRFDFAERFKEAFLEEWRHMYRCLSGDESVLVTKEEVISVTLTVDAINLSMHTASPVSIDHATQTFCKKT